YEQGVDITCAPQLVALAERCGFDRGRFAEAFTHAETRAATAADFSWVQGLGIAGFPTLLAERNGQLALLTNGYQPLERLQPLLGRWLQQAVCACPARVVRPCAGERPRRGRSIELGGNPPPGPASPQ